MINLQKLRRITFQNAPENVPADLYLDEDDLKPIPPLGDEEAKLEAEEIIAKRINPGKIEKCDKKKKKKKNTGTGFTILTPKTSCTPCLLSSKNEC